MSKLVNVPARTLYEKLGIILYDGIHEYDEDSSVYDILDMLLEEMQNTEGDVVLDVINGVH